LLTGKNILVTGGTRGIGRQIVEVLSAAGSNVSFTYAGSAQIAREMENTLPNVKGYELKLGSELVDRQLEEIVSEHKILHGLVNNAGITNDGFMLIQKEENWKSVLDVNLMGSYKVTKAFLPALLKQKDKASIVFVSSVAGIVGVAGQTNYSVSKSGLIALTKSLSKELAPKKIRVNAVSPGYITSDMTDKLNENLREQFKQNVPLRRFGNPEEIANVVEFLLSDKASYITAQNIVVDGGLTG
jgi:3-oxoacyl-[acyl-carrier protein] reductase